MTGTPSRFPLGFRVRLRDDVRRYDDGRLLIGGSPLRAVRLNERARSILATNDLEVIDATTEALASRLLDGNLADPALGDTLVPADDITVVVPVRDRAAQLDRCLTSLTGLPVIVVDDASHDPAAVAAVAERHRARLVALPVNIGPGGARNAGLVRVTTPYVAFVDSDVRVTLTALRRLARHLADTKVALVGPLVQGKVTSARPRWFERYDAAASSLDLGSRPCSVRPGARVAWLPSACLVARTSALGGGFDATMRVGEDVDLVWRLVEAEHAVRYDPTVAADHDVRTSIRDWLGRKFVYGTGAAALADRHGAHGAPAVLAPVTAAAAAALLIRRWWALPLAAGAVAHTARGLRRTLPDVPGQVAVRLAGEGLGWAVRQEAALLLRHWWPLGLVGGLMSRHVRRAVASAVLVDLIVFSRERPDAHILAALPGRRLDDLAYGTGLWLGAIRTCSTRSLRIRRLEQASGRAVTALLR